VVLQDSPLKETATVTYIGIDTECW